MKFMVGKLQNNLFKKGTKMQIVTDNLIKKTICQKGDDVDGGVTSWLVRLGIGIAILGIIFVFLKGFAPEFLTEIFNKVKSFFA